MEQIKLTLQKAEQKVAKAQRCRKRASNHPNHSNKKGLCCRCGRKVSPHKTSQICPNCGNVRKKDLSERWHSCECGCELGRDTASVKVILDLGHKQFSVGTRPTSATA